jgi:hypothetical protein
VKAKEATMISDRLEVIIFIAIPFLRHWQLATNN